MLKIIPLDEAIGCTLAHDITEIRPGEFKGPAFRKGHRVCPEDLCHLQRLGKNHIYVMDLEGDEIHENEAAAILAGALAGEGILWKNDPKEGKISLTAEQDGLLQVNTAALAAFNMVDEVMCATLHNHSLVKKGELVAATRAIPLVMKRAHIEHAAAIARQNGSVVSVKPLRHAQVGILITGNEVFNGLIQDRFAPILTEKLTSLGSTVSAIGFAPDSAEAISEAIRSHINRGCDLLLLTGGMSVDPDDVTRHGIRLAGADEFHYGSAVLPGAMFVVAYLKDIPLLGVPACALHHRVTVLDLVLPRVLAGER
ncbi:MAG: molybdopterin-binding protein, partial [Syntrophobacteraceae bacterium]|nr:molybdopterin-binding protein [Syntrophobacteraceae bacterium]